MSSGWRFNPPPGWPPAPPGFAPTADWHPDPSWPPAPEGWTFWIPVDPAAQAQAAADPVPPTEEGRQEKFARKAPWQEAQAKGKADRNAAREAKKQAKTAEKARRREQAAAARQAERTAKAKTKQEREQRKALSEAQAAHWRREQVRRAEHVQAESLARTVRAIASGMWPASFGLSLKRGEAALWGGGGQLVEPRRTPGTYQGRSQGVSLRITKGVWYRVGASQGTFVPGTDEQTVIDGGGIVVTTTRVVFRGSRASREWQFRQDARGPIQQRRGAVDTGVEPAEDLRADRVRRGLHQPPGRGPGHLRTRCGRSRRRVGGRGSSAGRCRAGADHRVVTGSSSCADRHPSSQICVILAHGRVLIHD